MPTLTLALIVKDEAAVLGRCLASVRGLADEIVVVDTGSSDGTRAVAEAFGARLGAFPWNGDFAAARNESLRLSTGDWVLVLDADETLDPRQHPALREALEQAVVPAFRLVVRSYGREPGPSLVPPPTVAGRADPAEGAGLPFYSEWSALRLFRRLPGLRFAGAIHERLESGSPAEPLAAGDLAVVIEHFGGLDPAPAKTAYYLELAERDAAAWPQDPERQLHLAVRALAAARPDAALAAMRRAVQLGPLEPRLRQGLIDLDLFAGQDAQAAADAMEALRALPGQGGGQWHTLAAGALLRAGHAGPGRTVLDLGLAAFPGHPGLLALAAGTAAPLKLNMGCGRDRRPGFVNVDHSPLCGPDQIVDLETTPWPWGDDSVEEVVFQHCLEHLGATSKGFLALIQELYRVCRDGAKVRITVPHPRHDNFINDPTHVRVITPQLMALFSRKQNAAWARAGNANTPLAEQLAVDFEITSCVLELEEPYATRLRTHSMTQAQVEQALREKNNVCSEYRMEFQVRKGSR